MKLNTEYIKIYGIKLKWNPQGDPQHQMPILEIKLPNQLPRIGYLKKEEIKKKKPRIIRTKVKSQINRTQE